MTQRVSLSIEQWMALREGGAEAPPIWFTVVGGSMRPLIRVDRDRVMLVSVDPQALRVGDIVLFRGRFRGGDYCLHRVWKINGDRVQTFGDGLMQPDGWLPRTSILGRAQLIERGNTTIDCDDPKWRKRAARWAALWWLRPFLMLPHRVADKVERTVKKEVSHGNTGFDLPRILRRERRDAGRAAGGGHGSGCAVPAGRPAHAGGNGGAGTEGCGRAGCAL